MSKTKFVQAYKRVRRRRDSREPWFRFGIPAVVAWASLHRKTSTRSSEAFRLPTWR